jgi:hypothetical protein
MMVKPEFASEQIRRLAGLNYYPREDDYAPALKELVEAARGADSEECLKTAISAILYDAEDCPKPADIRRVVRVENDRARELAESQRKESEKRGPCEFCHGTGWAVRTYILTRTAEEISGEVKPRVTKQYLLNDAEIETAKKSLSPGQEVISGVDRCSCQGKTTS